MLSQGDPSFVLHRCSDYWDGEAVWPLQAERRQAAMDMYEDAG